MLLSDQEASALPVAGRREGEMSYSIDRIPGELRIDPDAGGQERQRKRERPQHKADARDSVSISDEARMRSVSERDPEETE
jgi:hypothetical protein